MMSLLLLLFLGFVAVELYKNEEVGPAALFAFILCVFCFLILV